MSVQDVFMVFAVVYVALFLLLVYLLLDIARLNFSDKKREKKLQVHALAKNTIKTH